MFCDRSMGILGGFKIPSIRAFFRKRTNFSQLHWEVHCGKAEKLPLSKFGPNNQNCLFKVKLDIKTILNMLNLKVVFTFLLSDWKNLSRKLSQRTVKNAVCHADISRSFYFIKYWPPCLSWENINLTWEIYNLNNFSCKQWKSQFLRCSTREVIGISFGATLRCYLQHCFLKVEDAFFDYISSSQCRMILGTSN